MQCRLAILILRHRLSATSDRQNRRTRLSLPTPLQPSSAAPRPRRPNPKRVSPYLPKPDDPIVSYLLYPIDHLVLPTADLDVARARLTALGFTVAPVGVHPFGTINCCVYLASGAFLELLAIGDKAAAETAIGQGNVFVSRDATYRMLHGQEGFSALVFGTADAAADHRRFQQLMASPPATCWNFRGHLSMRAGNSDVAGFKLAFAADRSTADVFFFTCQRLNAPQVDRSALERHPNGVQASMRSWPLPKILFCSNRYLSR